MDQKEKNNKLLMTPEGLQKVRDELRDLIENKRPEVAKRIQDARKRETSRKILNMMPQNKNNPMLKGGLPNWKK